MKVQLNLTQEQFDLIRSSIFLAKSQNRLARSNQKKPYGRIHHRLYNQHLALRELQRMLNQKASKGKKS